MISSRRLDGNAEIFVFHHVGKKETVGAYLEKISECNRLHPSVSSAADKEKQGKKDDGSPFKGNVLGKEAQHASCSFFARLLHSAS